MAKIGIVYATKSKMIRRIIVPDADEELNDPAHVGTGESILVVDKPAAPHSILTCQRLVRRHVGVIPPSSHCAVMHPKGHVVGYIHADPAIDSVEGHRLVRHHGKKP